MEIVFEIMRKLFDKSTKVEKSAACELCKAL